MIYQTCILVLISMYTSIISFFYSSLKKLQSILMLETLHTTDTLVEIGAQFLGY
jgi:hypothetical protein